MVEKTLVILKPDCMGKNLYGDVLLRFSRASLEIVAGKMVWLNEDRLKQHYDFLVDKPFFPEIVRFMMSRPVLIFVLKGEGAIGRVRELLGPTDSTLAPKGTIRGDMGKDKSQNLVHASDSPEAAEKEIGRFFGREEIFG
ncbi:MAG: nucleoside-diphosphate kinase [Puniceicoccales bacterium]|jgi:nucleoside-diphosphate kinase|nr:nucleoside-diphosphate kinase [Puniceicoccales bacterium]